MTYPFGLKKDVVFADLLYSTLFPMKERPFSNHLSANKKTLTGDASKIEKMLTACHSTMHQEIMNRIDSNRKILLEKKEADVEIATALESLHHSIVSASETASNAEGLMFSYFLLKHETELLNNKIPSNDDVKWLKAHWNILNDYNKYNLNTAAIYIITLGILLIFTAILTALTIASITASLALAPTLAIFMASILIGLIPTVVSLGLCYMANTRLTTQDNTEQSLLKKIQYPLFSNNDKRSHVCIIPGAASVLSFFAPTTSQRQNKNAIKQLDNVLDIMHETQIALALA